MPAYFALKMSCSPCFLGLTKVTLLNPHTTFRIRTFEFERFEVLFITFLRVHTVLTYDFRNLR